MSTGFIKPRLWNLSRIMQDVARHGKPVGDDPKVLYVSYWHGKAYGGFSRRRCCACGGDLDRYPVYYAGGLRPCDLALSDEDAAPEPVIYLCATCMEKKNVYRKRVN